LCPHDLKSTHSLVIDNIIINPDLRPLVNGLTLFIWQSSTPAFNEQESEAFEAFLENFSGSRPWTIPICNAAWNAYSAQQRSIARDRALGIREPEQPDFTPEGFDKLDTNSLEALRVAVMQEKNRGKR
jgi:hypothetical protein